MTKQEFLDKYGKCKVKFSNYYKYTFSFSGKTDSGEDITVNIGGNSDDTYHLEVSPERVETVNGLDPFSGAIYKDRKEVCRFYDY